VFSEISAPNAIDISGLKFRSKSARLLADPWQQKNHLRKYNVVPARQQIILQKKQKKWPRKNSSLKSFVLLAENTRLTKKGKNKLKSPG